MRSSSEPGNTSVSAGKFPSPVGEYVGDMVGSSVGCAVGSEVGADDGDPVVHRGWWQVPGQKLCACRFVQSMRRASLHMIGSSSPRHRLTASVGGTVGLCVGCELGEDAVGASDGDVDGAVDGSVTVGGAVGLDEAGD